MRRFSQRSALVTLSEINITPLLDLAFVLLIIFIITTPLLEQSLPMKLPSGGAPDQANIDRKSIRTVEISQRGEYRLDKMPMSLAQLESELVKDHGRDANLIVYIRADENGPWKNVAAIMDRCQKNNITRFSVRMEPPTRH